MQFIFQAAVDLANKAKRLQNVLSGKYTPAADETITPKVSINVTIGFWRLVKGSENEYISASAMDTLVTDYFKERLPDALQYAASILQDRADNAMIAAKGQLEDRLAEIAAIEKRQKEQSNV